MVCISYVKKKEKKRKEMGKGRRRKKIERKIIGVRNKMIFMGLVVRREEICNKMFLDLSFSFVKFG